MDKVSQIREARAALRREGKHDSQRAVIARIGGSKRTMERYWHCTAPPSPVTHPAAVETTTAVAEPETTAGNVDSNIALEEAFEDTFEAFVEAGISFLATQGIPGNGWLFPYASELGRVPRQEDEYCLPRSHPLVRRLEIALDAAYTAHLSAWQDLEKTRPTRPVFTAPRQPVFVPPPPPEVNLENLQGYYYDRNSSAWPSGLRLEDAHYEVLQELLLWCEREMQEAGRERFKMYQDANLMRYAPTSPERLPLRQLDHRWGAAMEATQMIRRDMDALRERARDEGRKLA